MTAERNYAVAIATLGAWFKSLAPVFQPMRCKTKTSRSLYTHGFSGALSKLQVIAGNSDWLIGLFAPAVIGRSNYFGIVFFFFNGPLKTAL